MVTDPSGAAKGRPEADDSETHADSVVGQRRRRIEDSRLISGRARFLDDIEPRGCLSAAFVRSEHAHARIVAIDASAALALDGVVAIYTHKDLGPFVAAFGASSRRFGGIGDPLPLVVPDPGLRNPRTQRPLAAEEVHFVGEPIALVVATSRALAEDVADLIEVEYDLLEPAPTLTDAAAGNALAHSDVAENLAGVLETVNGDPDRALASARHIISRRCWVERGAAMPIETRGVLADYDAGVGRLTVFDTTQCPTTVRLGLAQFFGLEERSVELVAPDIGGAFGVKIAYWYPEELLVPFAAIRLGAPVKWVEDRREHFIGSNHERAQVHDARMALDGEAHILALEDRFLHDCGAYVPYGLVLPFVTMSRLPGVYRIPNLRLEARALYTNASPTTPYRGAGQPEASFVLERLLDAAAAELGVDRVELRRRNMLEPGDYPHEPGTMDEGGKRTRYDSGNPPAALNKALELVRASQVPSERKQAERRGARLGFGIGCYVESSGAGLYEGARVRIDPSGRVFVATGSSSHGQGHATIFAQIAAEVIGVDLEDVDVVTGDSRESVHGAGTFGSRIAVIGGNAVANAARVVRERALGLAAEVLEASVDDLEVEGGFVRVRGGGSGAALGELAALSNPLLETVGEAPGQADSGRSPALSCLVAPGLEACEYFSPRQPVYAYGCHAAVVEVDPETYQLNIVRYAAIRDCGNEINPTVVDGQIVGGIAQGIGGAFYERMHYGESGQLENANFMDYLIPYSTEVPEVALGSLHTPSPVNPLGVKGTGQGGVMPVAAAIIGAIEDALGITIDETPVSPDRLFALSRVQAG